VPEMAHTWQPNRLAGSSGGQRRSGGEGGADWRNVSIKQVGAVKAAGLAVASSAMGRAAQVASATHHELACWCSLFNHYRVWSPARHQGSTLAGSRSGPELGAGS
jgi:hypothetical protein